MTKLELLEAELETALIVVQNCRAEIRTEKDRLRSVSASQHRFERLGETIARVDRGQLIEQIHDQRGYTYKAIAIALGITMCHLESCRSRYRRSLYHPERYDNIRRLIAVEPII